MREDAVTFRWRRLRPAHKIGGDVKKVLAAVLLGAVLGMSGCGTLYQALQPRGPAFFGGTRMIIQQFGHEQSHIGDYVFYALDLPISFAFDGALILVGTINEIYEGGIDVYPQHPKTLGLPAHVSWMPAPATAPTDVPVGPELAAVR